VIDNYMPLKATRKMHQTILSLDIYMIVVVEANNQFAGYTCGFVR